jgi:hypothetical protein
VPTGDSTEPDPFSVTASGPDGAGPAAQLAIVPRPLPQNGGGGCGYGPAHVTADVPGSVDLSCEDDDGDPLSVEILTPPEHGVAAPALVTPALYGWDHIAIPYVPTPGYEGDDCVKIRVADGHGLAFTLTIDIHVEAAPLPVDVEPPPLPPLPPVPPPPPVPAPPAAPPPVPPVAPAPQQITVQSAVEQALGTAAVRRVRSYRGAEVWARSKISRQDLMRYGQAPGLVVVCAGQCKIRSDARLATGVKGVRSSPRKTVAAAMSGQPQVVALAIGRAERRALARGRRSRAKFTLSIRPAGAPTKALRSSIPVSR